MRVEDLNGLVTDVGAVRVEILPGSVEASVDGSVHVDLRVSNPSTGEMKQQRLTLVPADPPADPARVETYLTAWLAVLPEIVQEYRETWDDDIPPPDGLVFPQALGRWDGRCADEFFSLLGNRRQRVTLADAQYRLDLRNRLARLGLSTVTDAVLRLYRPGVRLLSAANWPFAADLGQPGRTRLGGVPDLPDGVGWPHRRDRPMSLLLQVDLADIHDFDIEDLLPASGILQVFADLKAAPDDDPDDRGGVRVLFHNADRMRLRLAEPPPDCEVLPARAVRPAPAQCLPPAASPFYDVLAGRRDTWDTFADLWNEYLPCAEDRPLHRVLGYPDPIQDDPWRHLPATPPAADWRLLFQVDAEPDASLGDDGVWMVFVSRDDLRNGDLSRAHGVWQVH